MTANAALIDAVRARLAEDPQHVREALALIVDPDALPERTELTAAARAVNARRLTEARQQFFDHAHRGDDVRARLGGVSRQALNQRVRAGKLLALVAANTSWFPSWQFTADGSVVADLDQLLAVLPASPIAADRVMRAPLPEEQGRSVADLVAANNLPLAVHYARTAGGER